MAPTTTTTAPPRLPNSGGDAAAESDDEAAEDDAATDVADAAFDDAFFGDPFPGPVTFFNGGFVRLDQGFDGFEVAFADDGVNWELQPTEGLPQDGFVIDFEADDDGLVAIIEIFPFSNVDFVDPFQLIFESGLLTQDQLDDLCDVQFGGPGEPIVVTTCDFEEIDAAFAAFEEDLANAANEAERAAIEEEFFALEEELFAGVEVLRLEPGDAFYDEVIGAFIAEEEAFSAPPEFVVATSNNGVFWEISDLPQIPVDEGGFVFVNDAAISEDRLALLVSIEPEFIDPFQIIFEAGLLTEEELDNFCDIRLDGPGEPIIITSCDFDEVDAAFAEFEEAIANAATDEERAAIEEEFFALEEELFGGQELLRLEPGDEFYDEIAEGFFAEPETDPVVLVGTIGGQFDVVELPFDGFPNSIVATDEGFITTGFDFVNGGTVVLRSTDGLTWTQVERFQGIADGTEFADVTIAANSDLALAIVVDFSTPDGGTAPVVLRSDDLGNSWAESEIPTELFGIFPQPVGGEAGFAALIEGTTEPFNFFGPELVEVVQGDFVMEIRLNEGTAALRLLDGTVVHESVQLDQAFGDGEVPGVLRIDPLSEDAIWLDPETGEDLIVFSGNDLNAAVDEAFLAFEEEVGFEEPEFVSELWFSADGETWVLIETFEPEPDEDQFSFIAAIGDDEIVLLTETFPVPPEDLFAFEEEGREPTPAEIQAIDEFFINNSEQTFEWTRVPVG